MQEKTKNKDVLLPLTLAAAISVAVFLLIAYLLLFDLFFARSRMQEIDIPKYVGENEEDITEIPLVSFEKNYVFSNKVPSGVVISQSKIGKVKVEKNGEYPVRLTVSLGRETHKLPNLCGLDIYEASGILRQMGCTVKTQLSESEEKADTVLFSIPKADDTVRAGDEVILYVASRRMERTVTVPDFYGYDAEKLELRVNESGLSIGNIEFIYSEDFLPDTVIYQSVGKGCRVKMGESIDFYIAKAPQS